MFDKLRRKIVFYVLAATIAFLALICAITGFIIIGSFRETFVDNARETINLAISYSELKLETIQNEADKLAGNADFAMAVAKAQYDIAINPKLNLLRSQFQEEIVGIVVYGTLGRIYKTYTVSESQVVPLAEIEATSVYQEMLETSHDASLWVDTADGHVTHFNWIIRIRGEADETCGIMLVHIDPDYLFRQYFRYETYDQFTLYANFVVVDGEINDPSVNLPGALFEPYLAPNRQETAYFAEGTKHLVIEMPLYEEDYGLIAVVDPVMLRMTAFNIGWMLVGISLFFLGVALLVANLEAKRVVARLATLQLKMRSAPDLLD